ncbi:MAG: YitT family protein [Oscillospiraceae bacterium]
MKNKYSAKDFGLDLVYDFVGCFIFAVAINCFAVPAHFATGGISGVALILNYLTKQPVGVIQLVLNIPLVLISYKILGRFFILRTAKTMVIMSVLLDVLAPVLPVYTGDAMLAAIFTGLLDGIALVIIFLRGGSTGGTDFITMSIRKKKPHMSLGSLSVIINIFVLILGAFAFGNIDAALYGAIAVFVGGLVIDKVMYGVGAGKMAMIITDKGAQVAKSIDEMTGRGSSILKVQGAYTGKEKSMVISAMSKKQIFSARRIAHTVDENCFVMITSTDEVFGQGFMENKD